MHKNLRQFVGLLLILCFVVVPLTKVWADDSASSASTSTPQSSPPSTQTTLQATDTSSTPPSTPSTQTTSSSGSTQTPSASSDSVSSDTTTVPTPTTSTTSNTNATSPTVNQTPSSTTTPKSPKIASGPQANSSSPTTLTPTQINSTGAKQLLPQPDPSTGALTYTYPITTPPGRNGIQPDLNLIYNSQNLAQDGAFGYGWSASIPYISRVNKTGTDQLYSSNYFTSSLSGDLVLVSGSTYAPRVENGDFLKYTFSSNTWTMTDKKGTVYTFGSQAATRQDNPNNSSQIFKWMLEKVQDTNGNFITYTYFKDSGQIYPSSIVYASNGSNTGIFEVDFQHQSRTDAVLSYATAFLVTTNYRISEIDVKTSGTVTHKYVLAYTTGDNGVRSMLSTVTESGTDEVSSTTVTLPAVTFSHNKSGSTGWTNSNWNWPTGVTPDFTTGSTVVADVNGDGLPDIMQSYTDTNGVNHQSTYLNNGDGTWTLSSAYAPPMIFESIPGGQIQNDGVIAIDLNGDGLPDLVNGMTGAVWLNTGSGWTQSTNYQLPITLTSNLGDTGARIADLNGDGLPDLFETQSNSSGGVVAHVYMNTASGWSADVGANWTFPYVTLNNTYPIFADLNGDGIADILYIYINPSTGAVTTDAYLGTGTGTFVESGAYNPTALSLSFYGANIITDPGVRVADVNGDGLPDLVLAASWGGTLHTQTLLNTGSGWETTSAWNSPVAFSNGTNTSAAFIDTNASGLAGIYTASAIYWSSGNKTDLLSKINYSQGGIATVNYKVVSAYKDGSGHSLNPGLPLMLQTVSQITLDDGTGNQSTSSYSYSGGSYYYNASSPLDRKFAGFATITKTDAAGNTTKTFYHQANGVNATLGEYNDDFWKIGKVYRVEIADPSGNLYEKTINRWDDFDQGNTNRFVKLIQTVDYAYDGLSTHKDKAESYTYSNTNGNIAQKIEYGLVVGNNDGTFTGTAQFTTNYTYAAGGSVIGLPDDAATTDQNSTKVKERKYLYDSQAFGSVTNGNLTEQDDWISGTTYAAQKKTYDGTYGLVTQSKDPNGNATNYSYDVNNLYPATVTDPLTHQTQYTYDYSSGKVRQTTDINGRVFVNKYDGLDRLIETDQPDLNTPTMLVPKVTYAYTDTSGAVSIVRTDYLDSTNTVSTYTYYDGLNREIQDRKTEASSNYQVKDYVYGNLGLLQKESLPYFGSGSSKTSPTTTSTLYISYAYDPLYRITTTTNAVGTTTNAYANWKLTVTDANGKTKDSFKDAYGNLIEVDEHNSGSTYVTTYNYDYLGDLLKITDANGNIRNFTYDGLGRRLSAQDLHTPSASTISTWNYTYDSNGNLTKIVDPNGNTINYTYDALNRKLTEGTNALGTQVTNGYDSGTDGIGRLISVTAPAYTQTLSYNPLGYLSSETKTISTKNYATSYTYNRQGQQLTITNPDSSKVQYVYDAGGLISKVQRKESTDSGFSDVVSSFTYSPTEAVATEQYANGDTTTNTYDPTKLYRLTNKQTVAGLPPQYSPPATVPVYGPSSSSWGVITLPPSPQPAVTSIAADPMNSWTIYAGTYNNGLYKSSDEGQTWSQVNTGANYTAVPVLSVAFDPGNHQTIYVTTGTHNNNYSAYSASVRKSTDGGNTWSSITGTLPTNADLKYFAVDPSNSSNLYVISDGNGLYKSTNGGSSWSQIYNSSGQSFAGFVINPSSTSTIYVATMGGGVNGQIYKSTNGGSNWTSVFSTSQIGSIAIDPTTPSNVYAGVYTYTAMLYETTNSGSTWNQINTNSIGSSLPEALVVNPLTASNVFISNGGVVYSSGGGWATQLPNTSGGSGALFFDKNLATLYYGETTTSGGGGLFRYVVGNQSIAPVINTFGAGPSWIVSGHSTTLYWTMSGGTPTSLSIDQGVGSVLNSGSTTVSPTTQTTYTLTATNSAGTATAHVTVTVNPPLRQNISYTYDNVGNITQVADTSNTDTAKTVTYTYDDLYRLLSATATNVAPGQSTYSETYSYDPVGNILSKTGQGSYTYGGTGSPNPDSVTAIGSSSFTYDSNGNLHTAPNETNTWDYNNRLTQTTVGSGQNAVNVTYAYDETGQRISYSNGTTTLVYPTDLYNTDGTNVVKHIFANGVEIATITGTGTAANVYSIHTDHLTGSNVVTDSNGNVAETLDYMPFGSIRFDEKAGSFSEQRKFASMQADVDTGLSYDNARYYNPAFGKFLSYDPAFNSVQLNLFDPQSLNPFAYSRNNPVVYIDPSGAAFTIYTLASTVSGYAYGLGEGVVSVVGNALGYAADLAAHPLTTISNTLTNAANVTGSLADTLGHPRWAAQQLAGGYSQFETQTPWEQGRQIGDIVGTLDTALALLGTDDTTPQSQIAANKLQGDAFRDSVAQQLVKDGRLIQKEVMKNTPFGRRYVDIEVSDQKGNVLGGIEAKTGASPYLSSQRAKDAYLKATGYPVSVIRGK